MAAWGDMAAPGSHTARVGGGGPRQCQSRWCGQHDRQHLHGDLPLHPQVRKGLRQGLLQRWACRQAGCSWGKPGRGHGYTGTGTRGLKREYVNPNFIFWWDFKTAQEGLHWAENQTPWPKAFTFPAIAQPF